MTRFNIFMITSHYTVNILSMLSSALFFFLSNIDFFNEKKFSGIPSECQTLWIQIKLDIMSDNISRWQRFPLESHINTHADLYNMGPETLYNSSYSTVHCVTVHVIHCHCPLPPQLPHPQCPYLLPHLRESLLPHYPLLHLNSPQLLLSSSWDQYLTQTPEIN